MSDFDTEIDNTIEEQLPVIEFAIMPQHIADTSNLGLQATLNLGAAEIIAGEFLAQAYREPGSCEELRFADVSFGPRPPTHMRASVADPFGLKEQGWDRLAPYLKPAVASSLATKTGIRALERKLSDEAVQKW